jgi:hypothetical protein
MHLAKGGFKIINGPPKNGKGLMPNEEDLKSSNKASLPQPTQAGRIETCQETIKEAMRCLENNDKDCITRLIEELIKTDCHNGNAVGKEVADKVKDAVHELWLRSDYELRCKLLVRLVVELGVSRNWFRSVFNTNTKMLNKWLGRCGIARETRNITRETRNNVVKQLEDLLRRMGWSEVRMCEEMWRFVGVDVDEFRMHGIEPCAWLEGLESLRDLRRPYWFGLAKSDLAVRRHGRGVELALNTTNSVDAVFFPALLGTVKAPSLIIEWGRKRPTMRYVSKLINLIYYIALGVDEWLWPIELNAEELERILNGFSDEELAMFVAGIIDGDGTVQYIYNKNNKSGYVYVEIAVCKACPKKFILDVLRDTIAERFGIVESIRSHKAENVLMFSGEDAVRLLRRVTRYMHHPIRRLRAELILAYYDGRISPEEFERLYEPTKYKRGKPDIKRNHALEALTQAAPQTHTHGEKNNY